MLRTQLNATTAVLTGWLLRNERRHVTNNERDMLWRLAVEDIARGVCRLSMTIAASHHPTSAAVGGLRRRETR
jgi:hypothetical protein